MDESGWGQFMKWRILSEKKLQQLIDERVKEKQALDNANYEREMLLKQANLQALQSQINPHFLYNTLECIRGMALLEDKTNIADIAWSLSCFFRYSISGKSNIVTLQDELENCETYGRIQNYRFQNRFSFTIEGRQEASTAMLPKLTLQPLVENAILHGLQDTLSGGVVRIIIERIGEDIRILVADNGCGMPPAMLEELSDRIRNGEGQAGDSKHNGIALHNVDRRIKLYFGQEYGLKIFSCEGMGTDVELRIAYRSGDEL